MGFFGKHNRDKRKEADTSKEYKELLEFSKPGEIIKYLGVEFIVVKIHDEPYANRYADSVTQNKDNAYLEAEYISGDGWVAIKNFTYSHLPALRSERDRNTSKRRKK